MSAHNNSHTSTQSRYARTYAHSIFQERDGGGNRYVLVSGSMYMTEMAKVLAEYFPGRPIVRPHVVCDV